MPLLNKGSVEYQDTILRITEVRLRDGAIFIIAEGIGPYEEYHGPANIYGPDGVLVQSGGEIHVPAAEKFQHLRLELTMTPSDPVAI